MGFYSRKKEKKQERLERISIKTFLTCTLPGVLKFYNDLTSAGTAIAACGP